MHTLPSRYDDEKCPRGKEVHEDRTGTYSDLDGSNVLHFYGFHTVDISMHTHVCMVITYSRVWINRVRLLEGMVKQWCAPTPIWVFCTSRHWYCRLDVLTGEYPVSKDKH